MILRFKQLVWFFGALCILIPGFIWCPHAHAEQKVRLGHLAAVSKESVTSGYTKFLERLAELGWKEGVNLTVVNRYAEDHAQLPILAAELVKQVDVVLAPGTQAAMAARMASKSIPIVSIMGDPVGVGLAESLARPGGNVTGMSVQNAEEMPGKWVEILTDMMPKLKSVAFILNPKNPLSSIAQGQVERTAASMKLKAIILRATNAEEYRTALRQAKRVAQAAIVLPDSKAIGSRHLIIATANEFRLPVLYGQEEFAHDGGLVSFGPDMPRVWMRIAYYVDRLFRGVKPQDLPIEQPTHFKLVLNLRAAKAIGLSVPPAMQLRSDEVMQ